MTTTQAQDFQAFLRSRRSVRRFLDQPVQPGILERVLETATWAPSAHNRQPWRFAVLETPAARERLAQAMGADFLRDLLSDGLAEEAAQRLVARSRERLCQAPAAVLLCMDMSGMDSYPDHSRQAAETMMGIQSVALAGGNFLLAAHAEGLAGVWVCAPLFAQETARKALSLPETWVPQALLYVGYPEAIPAARDRQPVAQVSVFL